MFVYSFKSTQSIIRHIIISGQYLVLYTSQGECIAIQPLINKLKLSSNMQGAHPLHHLFHNPFLDFSRKGDAVPHKHLKLSDPDRMQNLKDIFKFLTERQNSPEVRKEEHEQLVRDLHKERESKGHAQFPAYIQQALGQVDLTTPFFPTKELENVLSAFEKYTQSNSFSFYAEQISIHIEKVLDENSSLIYSKITSFADPDDVSGDPLQIFKYFEYLGDLRLTLLGIHHENITKWCEKSLEIIDNIKANPYHQQLISSDTSLTQMLEQISKKIKVKINELDRNAIIMMAAGLILIDYFRADSAKEYLRDIILLSIASVTTYYSARPIMKLSNNVYRMFTRPITLAKPMSASTVKFDSKDASVVTSTIKDHSGLRVRKATKEQQDEQLAAIKRELEQEDTPGVLNLTSTR